MEESADQPRPPAATPTHTQAGSFYLADQREKMMTVPFKKL